MPPEIRGLLCKDCGTGQPKGFESRGTCTCTCTCIFMHFFSRHRSIRNLNVWTNRKNTSRALSRGCIKLEAATWSTSRTRLGSDRMRSEWQRPCQSRRVCNYAKVRLLLSPLSICQVFFDRIDGALVLRAVVIEIALKATWEIPYEEAKHYETVVPILSSVCLHKNLSKNTTHSELCFPLEHELLVLGIASSWK